MSNVMSQYTVTMVRPLSAGGDREVTVRISDADVAADSRSALTPEERSERIARERAARRLYGASALWIHDAGFPARGQIMTRAPRGSGATLSALTPTVVLYVGRYGIARIGGGQ